MMMTAGVLAILFFDLISMGIMLGIGVLGLIGAIVGFKGKGVAAGILLLIAGIIPYILFYALGGPQYFFFGLIFFGVLIAFDPILMILGGILALALKSD